jgi:mRNA-degrading endonuclease toxin of MazEF toxin-antitoxin module
MEEPNCSASLSKLGHFRLSLFFPTVTVARVTSTIRGVPSEVVLNEEAGMKSPCAVNLHNAVTVSQQRLGNVWPSLVPHE